MTIKEIRKQKNIKQSQIVRKLNISHGCISNWEKGIRSPKIEQLPKLATLLGVSIEELVYSLIETKEATQNGERN